MPTTRKRYAVQQKASDAQFRRAVRAFARGLTPGEARGYPEVTHRPQLSPPTLYRLYGQLRRRLCEVGYYSLTPPDQADAADEDGKPFAFGPQGLTLTGYWHLAGQMVQRRRGVSGENRPYHHAEIFHRLMTTDHSEQEFAFDIETIIRITGPLNEPPQNIQKAQHFIFVRRYVRRVRALRQMQFTDPKLEPMAQAAVQLWIDRLPTVCDGKRVRRKPRLSNG